MQVDSNRESGTIFSDHDGTRTFSSCVTGVAENGDAEAVESQIAGPLAFTFCPAGRH
jgi:hypothetical protein